MAQQGFVRYSRVLEIVGDILKVQVPEPAPGEPPLVRLSDLAVVEDAGGQSSLAQVINATRDTVSLQVFQGTKGTSTQATVRKSLRIRPICFRRSIHHFSSGPGCPRGYHRPC